MHAYDKVKSLEHILFNDIVKWNLFVFLSKIVQLIPGHRILPTVNANR